MFPDFPKPKEHALRTLLTWTQRAIPLVSPLLRGISRMRQYEGKIGELIREDQSRSLMDYQLQSFGFALERDEMKSFDLDGIKAKLLELAKKFGDAQEAKMLQQIAEAADSVGNTISAGGEFQPEHLLEMLSKVWIDFDPQTGEPHMPTLIVHPSVAAKLAEKSKEWEQDPVLREKHERIMDEKREEWNARENNRKTG